MEGYWVMHYESRRSRGDGIVILQAGEIMGGDLDHLWNGTYEIEGQRFFARICIAPAGLCFEAERSTPQKGLTLSLAGYCTENYARLEGSPESQEDSRFEVTLCKCRAPHSQQALLRKTA